MRIISQFLALGVLLAAVAPVQAQMTYTATGGNAFIPEVVASVDLPDGNMLARTISHGFIWTNEENMVGGNGSLECFGSNTLSPEGDQLDGSGTCEGLDADGDVWWVWWSGGIEGNFSFTGGTGKYTGISGGGTWKAQLQYPDGKAMNEWEGTWTIPAMEMASPEME